jgi:hypothetical protein
MEICSVRHHKHHSFKVWFKLSHSFKFWWRRSIDGRQKEITHVIHWLRWAKNSNAYSGGIAYPSGAPEFTPGFNWGSCYSIFSFICMFCWSLFVLLYFLFWPLCFLFFFDIRILITPLVSSNSSQCSYLSPKTNMSTNIAHA